MDLEESWQNSACKDASAVAVQVPDVDEQSR
jgi:hypothetical protein